MLINVENKKFIIVMAHENVDGNDDFKPLRYEKYHNINYFTKTMK